MKLNKCIICVNIVLIHRVLRLESKPWLLSVLVCLKQKASLSNDSVKAVMSLAYGPFIKDVAKLWFTFKPCLWEIHFRKIKFGACLLENICVHLSSIKLFEM